MKNSKKQPAISVLIATAGRPEHLHRCLLSLRKNAFKHTEFLILDQTPDLNTSVIKKHAKDPRVIHIRCTHKNKSKALNIGIARASHPILAFTDDDCVVFPDWIQKISDAFFKYPTISAVYGKTHPYKSNKHQHLVCTSTFNGGEIRRRITHAVYHAHDIGLGNNMAIRKKNLQQIHGFPTWLGPGSHADAAEDAFVSFQLLIHNRVLLYDPNIHIYHNSWLNDSQAADKSVQYAKGETTCYGYFALKGFSFGRQIIRENIEKSRKDIREHATSTAAWERVGARISGLIIGSMHALKPF